ncbi:MAG: thioredoxin [Lachnospiraceae bacterium]|nr:thioredoxin [Lachnospiraceae bacterium]
MAVIRVTESNYEIIKASDNTVLLDFYATWCGPCNRLAPIIEEIAEENPDITVGKIDVEDEPKIAEQYDVMSIPTLVVLKNGQVAAKEIGGRTKAQILDMLK